MREGIANSFSEAEKGLLLGAILPTNCATGLAWVAGERKLVRR